MATQCCDTAKELAGLRKEIGELKDLVKSAVAPPNLLDIRAKAEMIRAAHASGDPKQIREVTKILGGQ